MDLQTHPSIDRALCGFPVEVSSNLAIVELTMLPAFAADPSGLVHGGFVFGALDYAAMLAVNHPNVVLGAAEIRFLAPVRVGQIVRCRAEITSVEGRKRRIAVGARVDGVEVASGQITAFVLDHHVLEQRGP